MYQSQYPASHVVSGIVRLIIGWGKDFFERFCPALRFDLVIAIGLDQVIRRSWIVLGFECPIEITKPFTRVTAHRPVFMGAVADVLLLPL